MGEIKIKVIIPLAGLGSRLRPHTYSKPKPLMYVAGKTVLGHILDQLKNHDVDEIIFIIGYLGDQIKKYVADNYDFKVTFLEQTELKGQAHAINLARDYVKDDDDALIWFVDTLSDADLDALKDLKSDGLIYTYEVEDPSRFGVVVPDENGYVKALVEKPDEPISNLVNIGLYYIKNTKLLFESINELIEKDMQTKGEFYLMDAFQIMVDKGAKLNVETVKIWKDCGKQDEVLETNKYLLKTGHSNESKHEGSIIIPPVHIADGAVIKNSIVGPHVSIAKGAVVKNSIAQDSIIGKGSNVKNIMLKDSLVGDDAVVEGSFRNLDIGDSSRICMPKDL